MLIEYEYIILYFTVLYYTMLNYNFFKKRRGCDVSYVPSIGAERRSTELGSVADDIT
jgi:hypothetical protein